ncbi:ribosome silencing factor [Nosocomiicoccus ampullae]|uniref:ribosome silencing factor n=1 Tax=Nosocomiicoccus ampullae TaxID=489910 RepID=UPI0030B7F8FE
MDNLESKTLLDLAVESVDGKRAEDIRVFDVRESSTIADYILICHGTSDRQVKAIARALEDLAEDKELNVSVEGAREGQWILIDLGDVVAHIFTKVEREYYNLERLYYDGEAVEL